VAFSVLKYPESGYRNRTSTTSTLIGINRLSDPRQLMSSANVAITAIPKASQNVFKSSVIRLK